MSDYTSEVLWLTSGSSLHDRSVTHVILYPAIELRALAFVPASGSGELDPFERAVLGSCAAGVGSVQEQAELLGLHPDFVGHLQVRLQEKGLIDERGAPRVGQQRDPERHQVVLFLYWDPHVGRLWPRFSTSSTRRSVSVSRERSATTVDAGDDGDPYTIAAFDLPPINSPHPEVAVEDCLDAIRSWSRDLRRLKRRDEAIERPSLVLMEERHAVRLCIPVHHLRSPNSVLQDPFAGPQWPHMLRTLAGIAETNRGLQSWLRVQPSEAEHGDKPPIPAGSPYALLEELVQLNERARGPLPERAEIQIRLDLIDLGHRLVDELERLSNRPDDVRAGTAPGYRDKAAAMFGFAPDSSAGPTPVPTADDDGLAARVLALLDRYQPGIPGALHRVAAGWPQLLSAVVDGAGMTEVPTLLRVCSALAAALRPQAQDIDPTSQHDQDQRRKPDGH